METPGRWIPAGTHQVVQALSDLTGSMRSGLAAAPFALQGSRSGTVVGASHAALRPVPAAFWCVRRARLHDRSSARLQPGLPPRQQGRWPVVRSAIACRLTMSASRTSNASPWNTSTFAMGSRKARSATISCCACGPGCSAPRSRCPGARLQGHGQRCRSSGTQGHARQHKRQVGRRPSAAQGLQDRVQIPQAPRSIGQGDRRHEMEAGGRALDPHQAELDVRRPGEHLFHLGRSHVVHGPESPGAKDLARCLSKGDRPEKDRRRRSHLLSRRRL